LSFLGNAYFTACEYKVQSNLQCVITFMSVCLLCMMIDNEATLKNIFHIPVILAQIRQMY